MKLFTGTRSLFTALILVGLVFGLQACSGGGGSSTPKDANPTGYYDNNGTASVNAGATTISDLQGLINEKRFMMISDATGLIYDGKITSISANDFAANVSVFKHGQPIASPNATISGTITEKSKITGTLTGTGDGSGTFTLQYASTNTQAANLTRIERNGGNFWDSEIGGGSDLTAFSVTSGVISLPSRASDGFFQSCAISSGTFTPINGTSLYTVTLNMTSCSPNADANLTYVGLAATWSFTGTDDRLIIGATDVNSTYSVNGDFQAQ